MIADPSAQAHTAIYQKRGALVRIAYLAGAILTWIATLGGRIGANAVIVLCYHGITSNQRERFAWQMKRVAGRGVSVDRLEAPPPRGNRPPGVCVTFDDAFACLLDHALPVMRELEVPATVFAVTDNLGTTPRWHMPPHHPEAREITMSEEQLRLAAAQRLCSFGSHTTTHPDLASRPSADVTRELVESRAKLQRLLGHAVEDLALPYGSYDERVIRLAEEAGYRRVHSLEPRKFVSLDRGPVVGRFSMSPDVWRIEFVLTCAGAYSWLYHWRHLLSSLRRALRRRKLQELVT